MACRRRGCTIHERGCAASAERRLKVDAEETLDVAAWVLAVEVRTLHIMAGVAADVENLEPERRLVLGELEVIMATHIPAPFGRNGDKIVGRCRRRSAVDHGGIQLQSLEWR